MHKHLTPEQVEELRKDFELGLVFKGAKMFPGGQNAGCLVRGEDGLYAMEHIEACWRGFLLAKNQDNAQLFRFREDRYIPQGMVTRFKDMTGLDYPHPDIVPYIFKSVLIICGETPNS